MGFVRYASFAVIASAIADETGSLPVDVLTVTPGRGKTAHRHTFEYTPKKGMLYVRSRAISSRCNDNYDEFPAPEIKAAYKTFVGKPVFVNHHNADHRRARGVIVAAALHEDTNPDGSPDTWVEVLMEVDAVRFPKLAAAVIAGRIDRTSMGTDVAYSECTYCGNKATNPAEYCAHIPKMKGQRITRTTASGRKESVLVAERCYGLGFFENSLLVEPPADPTAYAFGVDTRGLEMDPAVAHLARTASVSDIEAEGSHDTLDSITAAEVAEADRLLAEAYNDSGDWGPSADLLDHYHHSGDALHCGRCGWNGSMDDLMVCPQCNFGTLQRGAAKTADMAWVRQQLARLDGRPVLLTYTSEDGVDRTAGILAYADRSATVTGTRSVTVPDHHVLGVEETGYADASAGIEPHQQRPRENPLVAIPHVFPSGAWGARTAAAFGYHLTLACGHTTRYVGSREGQIPVGKAWTCPTHGQTTVAVVDGPGATYRGLGLDTFASLTDAEILQAEAMLTEAMMCSECNPNTGLPEGLCSAHAHMRKQQHQFPGHRWDDLPEQGPRPDSVLFPTYAKSSDEYVAPSETDDPSRWDGVSIKKDKDGYYVHTHRARSKSYSSPEAIPDSTIAEIEATGSRRTAIGEQKAPAEVNTLRQEACPVCGDTTAFTGQSCLICGYVEPPARFGDPDLDKAKQVDLRGGEVEEPTAPGTPLRCPSCDTKFVSGGGGGEAKATDTTRPVTPTAPAPNLYTSAGKPPWLEKKDAEPQKAEPTKDGEDEGKPVADPAAGDQAQVEPEQANVGDTCPNCGQAALEVDAEAVAAAEADPEQPTEDALVSEEEGQPAEVDAAPDAAEQVADEVVDETGQPVETEEVDEATKDEDEDKDKPPFLKHKKKSFRHRAGSITEGSEVGMSQNPAKQARNRIIEALQGQQRQIEALRHDNAILRGAVATIAKAAGLESHPRFAALVTAADEENEPVATTDEQALKPAATDDVESIGAAPAPANAEVTPGAVTDVQNSNVALDAEPFNNLVDVTEPTANTDGVPADGNKVEIDVRAGTPSQEPFPNNSGWTTSKKDEDQGTRIFASLKLARLRKAAGVEDGDETILGQAIASDTDLSLDTIQHESATLEKVLASRTSQPRQASRRLVPQGAQQVDRTMPSLAAQASAAPTAPTSGGAAPSPDEFGWSLG